MSENELLIEREKLLGRLVEINWYFMAKKYLTTIAKRKKFLTILEKQITQEANASNVIFVEEDGDVYICMIFRAKSIVKKLQLMFWTKIAENPFSQICKQEMSTFMELLEPSFNQMSKMVIQIL